jgi:hypothetical protein
VIGGFARACANVLGASSVSAAITDSAPRARSLISASSDPRQTKLLDHVPVWGYHSPVSVICSFSVWPYAMPPSPSLQEPDRAGSPTNSNGSPAQVERGKVDTLRSALWGLGIAILSNIANILKQLKDVVESLIQLEQFLSEHAWVSVGVIGGAIILGNVLLFRFLNYRLKPRIHTTYKLLAPAGSLAIVAAVLVTNWFSLQNLLQTPAKVQSELVSELASAQDINEGGFRYTTTSQGLEDPWTTAQALEALLTAGTYDRIRVLSAFSYIETKRKNEGFEVVTNQENNTPFIRTELADWVAVAYLAALQKSDLWSEGERAAAISNSESTLLLIVSQQDRSTGGWSPIPQYSATHQRTYATMMAVWALADALLSPNISEQTKGRLRAPFDAGVLWLTGHYLSNLGWEEDPRYPLGKSFPGLTYQVLFVLEKAQTVPGHNAFKNTEAFRRIKRELKNILHTTQVGDQVSVPTTHIMLGNYPCFYDFLAYPWLVSVLPILIADPDVPSDCHSFMKGLLKDELNKVDELPHFLEHAETWQVAEDLFGVSNFLNSNKTAH